MKYPRLPEHLDKRKALLSKDIAEIKRAWAGYMAAGVSMNKASHELGERYNVNFNTVLYHCYPKYREQMMAKNARAHSKFKDPIDYEMHRAAEIKRRQERIQRNPKLGTYLAVISAKTSKKAVTSAGNTVKRHTVKGVPLEKLLEEDEPDVVTE